MFTFAGLGQGRPTCLTEPVVTQRLRVHPSVHRAWGMLTNRPVTVVSLGRFVQTVQSIRKNLFLVNNNFFQWIVRFVGISHATERFVDGL